MLAADLSGAGQNDAVRAIARRHAERDAATPAGLRPFRLEELPASLPLDDALRAREAVAAATPGPARRGRRRPPAAGPRPVRDPGRAGGRTAEVRAHEPARFAVRAALDAGRPVLGLCPVDNALWRDLDLHGAGLRTDGLAGGARRPAPGLEAGTLVVVDDADLLKEGPLAPALLALVQQARGKGWRLVVAGSTAEIGSGYGGWVYELRKARQGLLLSRRA